MTPDDWIPGSKGGDRASRGRLPRVDALLLTATSWDNHWRCLVNTSYQAILERPLQSHPRLKEILAKPIQRWVTSMADLRLC